MTRTAVRAGIICALIFAWAGASLADGSSKPHGAGGRFAVYFPIIAKYNKSGERFRIEGSCQSSCTMLLAIRNVCVDPSARLLFHAALFPNEAGQKPPPKRQARMLAAYKPALRNYLVKNGYVDSFAFHTISGADIIRKFGYRQCPN
jgi:hypothetical protein